jgi:methyl-accepting chemotaxis protein
MKWFMNMKIASKLIASFLFMAFLAAVVGVVGIINVVSIKNADTDLYESNALAIQYSGEADVNFQQLRYNVLKSNFTTGSALNDVITAIDDYSTLTEESLNQLTNVINADNSTASDEIKNLIEIIITDYKGYLTQIDTYLGYLADNNNDKVAVMAKEMAEVGTEIRDSFISLMELAAKDAKTNADSNIKTAMISIIVIIAVIIAAVIISVVLGLILTGIIGTPLVTLSKIANMLSVGDINTEAVLSEKDLQMKYRKDEIGKLYLAFHELIAGTKEQVKAAQLVAAGDLTADVKPRSENDVLGKALAHLVDSLSAIVTSIINASEQVSAGANSLSDSSMALSQGATEQASSVEELTASIEEIASQTSLNSQNADMANEYANKAKTNADSGNTQMKAMLKAMDEINISSANINKIIKVIDDIAFQTNILALNAAVEAARAGQHGLGFAVVAEEVRTLAAKSASAASETTEMIEGSIQKVEAGTKIANETAKALDQIVEEVEKAAGLIGSIAVASKEQASAIEQINQGVMQISQVVQTNAATSEESAAASEELSGQAAQLKEIVNSFKINAGGSERKKPAPAADSIKKSVDTAASKQSVPKTARTAPASKPRISLNDGNFGKY